MFEDLLPVERRRPRMPAAELDPHVRRLVSAFRRDQAQVKVHLARLHRSQQEAQRAVEDATQCLELTGLLALLSVVTLLAFCFLPGVEVALLLWMARGGVLLTCAPGLPAVLWRRRATKLRAQVEASRSVVLKALRELGWETPGRRRSDLKLAS